MRNTLVVSKLLQSIYVEGTDVGKMVPTEGVPALLKQARPVREFVAVDYYLPGCPPPAKAISGILNELLEGRKPKSNGVKFG
jgi:NAD-reducing hydrogenase small subunit